MQTVFPEGPALRQWREELEAKGMARGMANVWMAKGWTIPTSARAEVMDSWMPRSAKVSSTGVSLSLRAQTNLEELTARLAHRRRSVAARRPSV